MGIRDVSVNFQHRWSGWPGAWCLDCGADDPFEVALAKGEWDTVEDPATGETTGIVFKAPGAEERLKALLVCPEPGSKRFDPYARLSEKQTEDPP